MNLPAFRHFPQNVHFQQQALFFYLFFCSGVNKIVDSNCISKERFTCVAALTPAGTWHVLQKSGKRLHLFINLIFMLYKKPLAVYVMCDQSKQSWQLILYSFNAIFREWQVLFEHWGHDWIQAHIFHQVVLEDPHPWHLFSKL